MGRNFGPVNEDALDSFFLEKKAADFENLTAKEQELVLGSLLNSLYVLYDANTKLEVYISKHGTSKSLDKVLADKRGEKATCETAYMLLSEEKIPFSLLVDMHQCEQKEYVIGAHLMLMHLQQMAAPGAEGIHGHLIPHLKAYIEDPDAPYYVQRAKGFMQEIIDKYSKPRVELRDDVRRDFECVAYARQIKEQREKKSAGCLIS